MSHLILGKSGPLKKTTVAAVRAVMAAGAAAGRHERPDIGTPKVKITVYAPKIDNFLNKRKDSAVAAPMPLGD